MGTGRRALLLLLMVIGLTAASLVTIALRPAVLGLDLQGGIEVILKGRATPQSPVTTDAINRSVEVIRSRVDKFGVSEPEIQTQGKDEIVVSLPGADDPQVVTDLIRPAQLRFYDYEDNLEAGPNPSLYAMVTRSARITPKEPERGEPTFYAFRKDAAHTQVKGAHLGGPRFGAPPFLQQRGLGPRFPQRGAWRANQTGDSQIVPVSAGAVWVGHGAVPPDEASRRKLPCGRCALPTPRAGQPSTVLRA